MNFIKSHFWYSQSQRNGILFLLVLLFSSQLILHFIDFSDDDELDDQQFALLEYRLDSLRNATTVASITKTFSFNPNFLSDFKAYQLGLSPEQIDRLFAFRKEGKFVHTPKEFQQITGITDSLLHDISPRFKFPTWVNQKRAQKTRLKKETYPTVLKDLNAIAISDLQKIEGIDHKMANRIIAYRSLLKGYSMEEQLYEVYGLKKEIAQRILKHCTIIEKPIISKLNVNTASFKELLHLPYVDYNLTKQIFSFRDNNDFFQSIEELKKIDSFPIEKFDRIALYLSAE